MVAAAVATVFACGVAQAQDNVVKAGIVYYTTNSDTSGLSVSPAIPLGDSDVETGNAATLALVYERRLTPNWGAELALGIPPRIDGDATGQLADLLKAAGLSKTVLSAKNVSPTFFVNYYFGDASAKWRPYLGAGINYTYFADIESSLPDADIDMSDSWGWALQGGISYAAAQNWGLFASVQFVDIESDVTAKTSLPGVPVPVTVKTKVDFGAISYTAGVWYAF
jgi:outer membrane protein